MEISPIPGIRALPAVKAERAEMRPPSFFDVVASAKPGDGNGQGSRRKAAGAEEDDAENEEDGLMLDGESELTGGDAREAVPARQVDYFA